MNELGPESAGAGLPERRSLSRREFVKATGIGVAGLAAVGAGPVIASAGAATRRGGAASAFNWRAAAGSTITLNLGKHSMTDTLLALLPDFEKKTGIKVKYTVVPYEDYYQKLLISLSSGASSGMDVINVDQYNLWQVVPTGGIEPLEGYIGNANLVAPGWDWKDIFPNLRQAFQWNGKPGSRVGSGHQYAVPLLYETYMLVFRQDRLRERGMKIPRTFPQLRATAKALTGSIDGQKTYGIAQRGAKDWTTIHPGFMSMYVTHGGRDFDANFNCVINSEAAVRFTDQWLAMLRESGPPNWLNQTWLNNSTDFLAGTTSMTVDADIEAPYWDVPTNKDVYGKIAVAPPPSLNGKWASNLWSFAIGMSAKSQNKPGAWLFVQWASHPDTLKKAVARRLAPDNSVRMSSWNDPAYTQHLKRIPGYLQTFRKNIPRARVLFTPNPEWGYFSSRWVEALHEAYEKPGSTKRALDAAAADINSHMKRVGLK